jgi:4-hydroxy-3-methylbut-2-enyl diphosphate reductase IspH
MCEQEKREMESYGDGYMAGVQEILRMIENALDTAERGQRLAAVEQILHNYGVREAQPAASADAREGGGE